MARDTIPCSVPILFTQKDFELIALIHALWNATDEEMSLSEEEKQISAGLFDLMNRYQSAISHSLVEISA